jgi:hypothetical protein
VSRDAVVELIRGTTTRAGLGVSAKLDKRKYEVGKDVATDALRAVRLEGRSFAAIETTRLEPKRGTGNMDRPP